MIMLKYLLVVLLAVTVLQGVAQKKPESPLYVIYIDNSLPNGDGLTGDMLDNLIGFMDTVKEKRKFMLFLSNGKTPQFTESPTTATNVLNGLTNKYANTPFPDQNADVTVLRSKMLETIKAFNGEVRFVFYVSNKFVAGLQDKYSPLVGLFPKEVAHLYSSTVKKVRVLINYPKIEGARTDADKVLEILKFNMNDVEDPLVTYELNTQY